MGILLKRDDDDDDRFDGFYGYWYDERAKYIRWGIFFGLLALIIGFILFSYIHAGRRLKKGLEPLAYHRWTVSRKRRARLHPNGAEPAVYVVYPNGAAGGSYYMHNVPPPVYVAGNGPPPLYPGPPPAAKSNVEVQNTASGEGAASGQQLGTTGGEGPAYAPQPAYHPPEYQGNSMPYR